MLGIFESMECAAEQTFDDMTRDCSSGEFRCGCGKITSFKMAQPTSANPYCQPCCPDCFNEMNPLKRYDRLTTNQENY